MKRVIFLMGLMSSFCMLTTYKAEANSFERGISYPYVVTQDTWYPYLDTNYEYSFYDGELSFRLQAGKTNSGFKPFPSPPVFDEVQQLSDILKIGFEPKADSTSFDDTREYIRFNNKGGYHYLFKDFPSLETITGLEYTFFQGSSAESNYSNFFSGAKKLTSLDVSNISVSNSTLDGGGPGSIIKNYNFEGFLQDLPNLEVLVLSNDRPSPNQDALFHWKNENGEAGNIKNALDFNNGSMSKLRELTFNSDRTPIRKETGLFIDPNLTWVRLTGPQSKGGKPAVINGKYEFKKGQDIMNGFDTQGTSQTWAVDVWGLEYGGVFKPIEPGEEVPDRPGEIVKPSQGRSRLKFSLKDTKTPSPLSPEVVIPGDNEVSVLAPGSEGANGSGFKDFYINWASDFKAEDTFIKDDVLTSLFQDITLVKENGENVKTPPFTQLTIQTDDSWSLNASMTAFKNEDKELQGAYIDVSQSELDTSLFSTTPTFLEKEFIPNGTVQLLTSRGGEGVVSLIFKDARVIIPKQSEAITPGDYTTRITWILSKNP